MRSWIISNLTHNNYTIRWKTRHSMTSNYHKFYISKTMNRWKCIHGPNIFIKKKIGITLLLNLEMMDKIRTKMILNLLRILGWIILRISNAKSNFSRFITKAYLEFQLTWRTGTPLRENVINLRHSRYSKISRKKLPGI